MKSGLIFLLLFLSASLNKPTSLQLASYDLAITEVNLFDSKNKTVLKNKTILIQADTIAAIIDSKETFTAKKTIEGNGRLITPGFIDTHTHLMVNYGSSNMNAPTQLPKEDLGMIRKLMSHQYLAHGITSIVDMGQPETWIDVTLNWQKNPSPEYPNLFICGGSIVSDEDRWQPMHHIEVTDPEDGRKKVQTYAEMGIKHMKLYRKLKKPDMKAMVDEAKKHNITVNTHVDNNVVTISEAMDFGILNFEHFFTLIPSVLSYNPHWNKMNKKYGIRMSPSIDEFAAHMTFFFAYIKENPKFDTKLKALFDRMAKEGATLSTAINVLASSAGKTDFFTSFEYFPIRKTPMVSYTEAQQQKLEEAFEAMMAYVKMAHDKGVKLRIGTDCRLGGESTLAELLLFYEAGIPIADILQIATLNGYEAMKLEEHFGSIEVGKKADLVLFDKNPFDNYKNFLSKKTIIKDGQELALKRSLAYDLQEVLVDEGTVAGLSWFKKNKANEAYGPLDADEMKKVVGELHGTEKFKEAQAVAYLRAEAFPKNIMKMDGVSLVNETYQLLRNRKIQAAIDYFEFSERNFPETNTTLALAVLISILKEGIPAGRQRFASLKGQEKYPLEEAEMNGVGYLLLQGEKTEEALAIFQLNVEAFPNSWNTYDSLAETYMNMGNKELAIKNYEKSVELNPENSNAIKLINKMKKK